MFGSSSPASVVAKRVREAGKEYGGAVNVVAKGLKVEGALFLPRSVERLRAVLVLINSGTSWSGLAASVYPDTEVRALAATSEVGLLLLRVTSLDTGGHMYFVTNAGAGADEGLALLLNRLAADSGHVELRNAPLLFWGHSAAGPFGTTFALRHPERTIAFVRYHSGVGGLPNDLSALQRIPGLFLQAAGDIKDNPSAFTQLEAEWKRARVAGAPWTLGIEPDAVHQSPSDVKKANAVLIPWIAAILKMRLQPNGQGLRDVTPDSDAENWFPDDLTKRGWTEVTRQIAR
jgi:pimeloyl-ACP methyl ester carboxylesterase